MLEALTARGGSSRHETWAVGSAQPAADDGRTPMDCALGGYKEAPTATHSDSAKPAASPDRTPWGQTQCQLGSAEGAVEPCALSAPRLALPAPPSPPPRALTDVLQEGRNIPRTKAPRRGPLMTPMTVNEP